MRLTIREIEIIYKLKNEIFGENSRIFLFGSRVDDSQKGGDIDLYLIPEADKANRDKKAEFIYRLQDSIGEQKIDLIIARDENRLIEKEARNSGVELDLDEIRLQHYLIQCAKHVQRIEEAYSDIMNILPLTADKYSNLTRSQVQVLDQYLFRFSKLQDTLGDKVFKLLIKKYDFTIEFLPMRDVLNKLEKYGFINDASEWIYLRKLRNDVAHQYEDEPLEMSQAINNLLSQKEVIVKIFENVRGKVSRSKLRNE